MNADILLLVAAALFVGAAFGVLAVGLLQLWHDRRGGRVVKHLAILLLIALALAGCDDDGGGRSYTAPQPQATPMPYGEPMVRDFAAEQEEQDRWTMNMLDAILFADEAVERRDAIR